MFFNKINPPTGGSNEPRKTRLPEGKQWLSHCGKRQRLRNLKKACFHVLRLKDEASLAALARLENATHGSNDSEYLKLSLMFVSLETSQNAQVSWAEAMEITLDTLMEQIEKDKAAQEITNEDVQT